MFGLKCQFDHSPWAGATFLKAMYRGTWVPKSWNFNTFVGPSLHWYYSAEGQGEVWLEPHPTLDPLYQRSVQQDCVHQVMHFPTENKQSSVKPTQCSRFAANHHCLTLRSGMSRKDGAPVEQNDERCGFVGTGIWPLRDTLIPVDTKLAISSELK